MISAAHPCRARGCQSKRIRSHLTCLPCWRRAPVDLRAARERAVKARDPYARRVAEKRLLDWFDEHPKDMAVASDAARRIGEVE